MSDTHSLIEHGASDYDRINRRILAIADEATPYELFDTEGQQGHARSSCIDLATAISRIPDLPNVTDIEIYADTLIITNMVVLSAHIQEVIIFARHIVIRPDTIIQAPDSILIRFYCSPSSCPFSFNLKTAKVSQTMTINLPDRSTSCTIQADGRSNGLIVSHLAEPPRSSFDAPELADRILDKVSKKSLFSDKYNEHLPTLLRYLLLLAAFWQRREPATAFDIGMFVSNVTAGIPKALDIFTRALTFAVTPVVLVNGQLTAQVNLVPVNNTKEILEAHLVAAKAFDDAFRDYKGQEANASNALLAARLAVEAAQDAEDNYRFLANVAKARFSSAQAALIAAQNNFNELQVQIPQAQKDFEAGIEKWKKKNIAEIVVKGLLAVGMVVGSIAAACVVPPAGAGAIAGVAEIPAVATEAANGVKSVEKMISIIDRLKEMYERIKFGLDLIADLVQNIQAIIELMSTIKTIDDSDDGAKSITSLKISGSDDTINMSADWDAFGLDMASLYEPIKEQGIDGGDQLFLLIAKMVIRGKAVLAAQQAVTTTGDTYAASLSQQLMATRNRNRLEAALPLIQGDPIAMHLLRRDLFQRLVSVRTSVCLDFRHYLDGLTWYALEASHAFLDLNPLKEIGEFYNDAATLQGAYARATAEIQPQTMKFKLNALLSGPNQDTGKTGLAEANNPLTIELDAINFSADRTAVLHIDPTAPCFDSLGRVRMKRFAVFLDGVSSPYVSLRVGLGPLMYDLSIDGSVAEAARCLAFSTTPTTMGFAYSMEGQQKDVVLDGDLSSAVSWPSPFRVWTVQVGKGVELSSVRGITLQIECAVTLV